MYQGIAFAICFLFTISCHAQRPGVSHSVVCLGNAGDITHAARYADALSSLLDTMDRGQTILFSGDIAQPDEAYSQRYIYLDTLVELLHGHPQRKLVFIPGDRDWDSSGPDGWDDVRALEEHVRELDYEDVVWPLESGCPGPARVQLDLTLNLIAINTQWWNHRHAKPTPATATCEFTQEETVLEELKSEIEDASYGNLIIAGHYPILSHGEYGGSFPFHKWVFPVPIISSAITAFRQNVGSPEEIANERYEPFREELEDVFKEYASMVYVSGHERNREVLNYHENVLLGSGAPENGRFAGRVRETVFSSDEPGVTVLNYDVEGNVIAVQYKFVDSGFVFESSSRILQAPCLHPEENIPVNERLIPCLQEAYVLTEMTGEYPDSVSVVANPNYERSNFIRAWFGNHYRDTWVSNVRVPVLNLDTTHGGLVPYSVGGGRQTKSLKFVGEDGYAYVFRSVDKDPSKALSLDLRTSLISLAVQDQTTTQYPYGAVVTSPLMDQLNILHPRPEVFVMPNDPKLGPFQEKYGNMLGMLEDFPTGRKSIREVFANADRIEKSMSMFRDLYISLDNRISKEEYARARVFDILVGDWSKHEDNWKWAAFEQEDGTLYRPIPRDRDHVFSRWDGILPWISDREWAKPQGEHFDDDIKDIRSLTWQARHQDRLLANELTGQDWEDAARYVQKHLSDSDIDFAIESLPPGVDSADAAAISQNLKLRRDKLKDFTSDFYDLLSKEVDVVGSIEDETFVVDRLQSGGISVEVFKASTPDSAYYRREFDPSETKEIRLFGLLGNDQFVIDGESRHSILVRVVPGQGHDIVTDSSSVARGKRKTRVYSVDDKDRVARGPETKNIKIPFDDAYIYRRTAFAYNTYLPYGYVFFNSGNGLLIGGGVNFTRQSYDKPDFSAKHNLTALVSTLGNLQFEYEGIIRHVVGSWDLTLDFQASKRRRYNYFFGLGNETEINKDSLRNDYYTLQYSNVYGQVGLRRQFWKRSSVDFGFQLGAYSRESNEGNIMDDVEGIQGVEPLQIARVTYGVDFDFRDRPNLPMRGMQFQMRGFFSQIINEEGAYGSTRAEVVWYGTARPVTFSGRIGGWLHHNQPPFYHLEFLGQDSNLRGYRRNRFAGDLGGAFFNGDARIQLIDNARSLIPHKIGLLLFYDVGRVWQSEENSNLWHQNFGIGIYAVPIRERFVIGLSIAFSPEEKGLLNFGFGKLF